MMKICITLYTANTKTLRRFEVLLTQCDVPVLKKRDDEYFSQYLIEWNGVVPIMIPVRAVVSPEAYYGMDPVTGRWR